MEIILGLSVIIILALILGFGPDIIIVGIIGLLGLAAAATELVFLFFAVKLIFSKRAKATFSRLGKPEKGRYDVAYYNTDEGELPNVFPAEMVLKNRLYNSNKEIKLRIDARKKYVYDRNARLTIILGVPLTTLLCAFLVFCIMLFIH